MSTLTEDLRRTSEIVQQGWCQGSLAIDRYGEGTAIYVRNDGDSHCLLGAAMAATADEVCTPVDQPPGHGRLYILLTKIDNWLGSGMQPLRDDAGWFNITHWNDRPGRTRAEVVALLDLIVRAEEKLECPI